MKPHKEKNSKLTFLTSIKESEKTDIYFSDPNVLTSIKQGIEDVKNGKVTTIKDFKNIWASIL